MNRAISVLAMLLAGAAWGSTPPPDWPEVVPTVKAAVVDITAHQRRTTSERLWEIPGVERNWITNLFDTVQAWAASSGDAGMSEGAGYFYDARGLVLTAAHVVSGSDRVWVTLADRRQLEARVVGIDTASDVAVLAVNGHGQFPVLPAADVRQLRVGDPVLAVGSPLGYAHSVSTGIISATREDNYLSRDTFIQTDTPLTHGNSGGVLVDAHGRAVGIVSYGYESDRVSFLVPIDRAERIASYLIRNQTPPRPCIPVITSKPS